MAYSVAFLEHVPEERLPHVISEMARLCKRGLHGVDFGAKDDGFDRTHCTLKPRNWWHEAFGRHAPGWPVEIIDKEDLERGDFPQSVRDGDGKVKLNVGCAWTMFYGWTNLDVLDQNQFAAAQGYRFLRWDAAQGLPFDTGKVDMIFASHFLEHLTFDGGLRFLREARRAVNPGGGVMRLSVPDAQLLMGKYVSPDLYGGPLSEYGHINQAVAEAKTDSQRLWELLHQGHSSCYDEEALAGALKETGWVPTLAALRGGIPESEQMRKEVTEMGYDLSIFMDCLPLRG